MIIKISQHYETNFKVYEKLLIRKSHFFEQVVEPHIRNYEGYPDIRNPKRKLIILFTPTTSRVTEYFAIIYENVIVDENEYAFVLDFIRLNSTQKKILLSAIKKRLSYKR